MAAVPRQALPSADRYKEIQQALASKGYLKSEPTGVWDAHSVDAMRQFQSDRKLDPSGKLTAASLIDLGLGPKHEISHPAVSGTVEPVADLPRAEQAPAPQP
ncbi:MAG TPA: peptidoglycan-binding domain-containing protein [Bryobacteraceae bacterium]|nr:peptidoglycan-binding domain-containing protein [Bryobacteraceae bacterium]